MSRRDSRNRAIVSQGNPPVKVTLVSLGVKPFGQQVGPNQEVKLL